MEAVVRRSGVSRDFVRREIDEIASIQRDLIEAEAWLARVHPRPSTRRALQSALADDRRLLESWERIGAAYGANGDVGDVAAGLTELMDQALAVARQTPGHGEVFDVHAALLALKRKQMDGSSGLWRIASAVDDRALRSTAALSERTQRESGRRLGRELAAYAKAIATMATA